eukprot:m.7877 g.7877  ORF g.7877 m.7877 type:complete len:366 (-) comp3797_c2_seq1:6303-7400(-)
MQAEETPSGLPSSGGGSSMAEGNRNNHPPSVIISDIGDEDDEIEEKVEVFEPPASPPPAGDAYIECTGVESAGQMGAPPPHPPPETSPTSSLRNRVMTDWSKRQDSGSTDTGSNLSFGAFPSEGVEEEDNVDGASTAPNTEYDENTLPHNDGSCYDEGDGKKRRKFKPWKWVKKKVFNRRGDNLAGRRRQTGDPDSFTTQVNIQERQESLRGLLARREDRRSLKEKNIIREEDETPPVNPDIIGLLERKLSVRSTPKDLKDRNILSVESEAEKLERKRSLKAILKRQLSQRSSVKELRDRKILNFGAYVDVYDTYDDQEYDRTGEKPWTNLTLQDKIQIKQELNDFKANEMPVHEESKKYTRFHK